MKATTSLIEDQGVRTRIEKFLAEFKVGTLLNSAGIRKLRGISPLLALKTIFELAFCGRNIFSGIHLNDGASMGKDVLYRFLGCERFNWRRFLGSLAQRVINTFLVPLTNKDREKVLILDITIYNRARSRCVELLSRIRDHSKRQYLNGFRLMVLGWSDGTSFVPVDQAMLSSTKKKNQIQGITKKLDGRTCGARRRKEALTKATDLILPMVKRALGLLVPAEYLLMDSWFAFPVLIRSLMDKIHVICMLKNTSKIHYHYEGLSLTLSQIYRKLRKRRGRARIKGSVLVGIGEGKMAKIVFVKSRRPGTKAKWLAILSTDLTLPDEEVVRIYGKRWDIEVFFKMAKQYLKLDSEIQVRDFDSILAHSTIVMLRYIFLAVQQRIASDERTLGPLFMAACDELRDLTITDALIRILTIACDRISEFYATSEQLIIEIIEATMNEALNLIRPAFLGKCES
jgi:hypothetical protein